MAALYALLLTNAPPLRQGKSECSRVAQFCARNGHRDVWRLHENNVAVVKLTSSWPQRSNHGLEEHLQQHASSVCFPTSSVKERRQNGCCQAEPVWALMKREQVSSARITGVLAATGNLLVKISILKGAALVSSRGIMMWLKKSISPFFYLSFNFPSVASSPSFFYLNMRLFISISFPLIVSSICPSFLSFAIVCPRHFLLCSSHSLLHLLLLLLLSWQSYE